MSYSSHTNCGRTTSLLSSMPCLLHLPFFHSRKTFIWAFACPHLWLNSPTSLRLNVVAWLDPGQWEVSRNQVWHLGVFSSKKPVSYSPLFFLALGWRVEVVMSDLYRADRGHSLVMTRQQGGKTLGPQHHWTSVLALDHLPQLFLQKFLLPFWPLYFEILGYSNQVIIQRCTCILIDT
jgi:hypothetical protein